MSAVTVSCSHSETIEREACVNWYLISCKSRKEQWVCQQLAGRIQEAFSPLLRTRPAVGAGATTTLQPLFPGYIFAAFDLVVSYFAVMHTPGVRGLVSAGTEPLAVTPETIAELKLRCPGGIVEIQRPILQQGQRVEIVRGPMQGLSGIFDRYLSANQRVIILLETIGRGALRTTLPASGVARIQSAHTI
jgi:transcriptional antiterminator RfaH